MPLLKMQVCLQSQAKTQRGNHLDFRNWLTLPVLLVLFAYAALLSAAYAAHSVPPCSEGIVFDHAM